MELRSKGGTKEIPVWILSALLLIFLTVTFRADQASASEGDDTAADSPAGYTTVYKGQDYSRVYDYNYYIKKYPSVVRKVGRDPEKVLRNFVKTGMKKGRRGCASFRVSSYLYGNADLRRRYGTDLKKYYLHYQNKGWRSKKRKATAVKIKTMQNPVVKYNGVSYARVYDYAWYLKQHPELSKIYRYDDAGALEHYVKNGFPADEKGKEKVSASSFAAVRRNLLRKMLSETRTAEKTDTIILVIDHQLSLWKKNVSGSWRRKLTAYCGYGKNGLSENRYEGDGTTPIGSFPILHAFGTADNPGTAMTWKPITPYSYWSGEASTYNTWVESTRRVAGEHLIDYYQYKYAMAIGFNRDPVVVGRGSAIFLHCKSYDHWYTGGCVGVEESVMKKLLQKCGNGTYIIIVRKMEDVAAY